MDDPTKSKERAEKLLNAWGSDMPQGPWMGIFRKHLEEALSAAWYDGYGDGTGDGYSNGYADGMSG